MRALTILGPGVMRQVIAPFRSPQVEIFTIFGWPPKSAPGIESFITPRPKPDVALVFGGDGTLHHALPLLLAAGAPLLVVPCGSGNDFARNLGIRDRRLALEAWQRFLAGGANLGSVDLGVIRTLPVSAESTPIYFCNVAGVGLDAAAALLANRLPRALRAHGGYWLSALAAIGFARRPVVHLEIFAAPQAQGAARLSSAICFSGAHNQWRTWKHERATLAAIANGVSYGGGIPIAPRAQLDDAKLDACFIAACGRLRMLRLLSRLCRARHLDLPEVEYRRLSRVRISSARRLPIVADGEFAGVTPAEFSVLPAAVRVIVP